MMHATASEMFTAMRADVLAYKYERTSTDATSPCKDTVIEALPGKTYRLINPMCNVINCKSIDLRWATANVLHFFTGSEAAANLRRYNKVADKFLDGDRWDGAYGAIAMPQIANCIGTLRKGIDSRRAIVSMGEGHPVNINRPACWSFLHFLHNWSGLNLLCYQRSLELQRVMPYDCILLSNILYYVSVAIGVKQGSIYWTVGSLHMRPGESIEPRNRPLNDSLVVPHSVLANPLKCANWLHNPNEFSYEPFRTYLASETEVRT